MGELMPWSQYRVSAMSSTKGGSVTAQPDVIKEEQTSFPNICLLIGMCVVSFNSIMYFRYGHCLVLNEV
jgi:hypothetical protein